MAISEAGRKALDNGYRATQFSGPAKHGYKVWPEDWKRTVENNTTDVEAWRRRLAR